MKMIPMSHASVYAQAAHGPVKAQHLDADNALQRLSKLDGDAPDTTDFANYFCTYGFVFHQV